MAMSASEEILHAFNEVLNLREAYTWNCQRKTMIGITSRSSNFSGMLPLVDTSMISKVTKYHL
ncbi:hypothetical protein N7517_007414 [Penicillium concentricum]|uniref:Uncharacterized protein n=1 Tax=Penicillium concentricum TaxID=293559 RepID=A0A9W9SB55_9EURO|nr:uncharacterized protein N7517_007414 [Penicillium concentricum]KAJ5375408.1 hypothetical protein N7517_007414 [Penicillium concentricum]